MNDFTMTRGERRATWALGSVFSLRMLGMFMVLPVLTTYGMSLAGASEALIGLAIGVYGMAQALLSMVDPVMLVGAFATPGAMTGATAIGSEDKNGVAAQHFRIDSSSFIGAMASMPPGSSIDVWIADDGYLVSLAVSGIEDSDFVLDVTDVNSPANVVERPS